MAGRRDAILGPSGPTDEPGQRRGLHVGAAILRHTETERHTHERQRSVPSA